MAKPLLESPNFLIISLSFVVSISLQIGLVYLYDSNAFRICTPLQDPITKNKPETWHVHSIYIFHKYTTQNSRLEYLYG